MTTEMRKQNKQLRAAIYVRVSTKDQLDGYSPEFQLEDCKKAVERDGYTLKEGHIFDDSKSGKTDKRPGWQSLLEVARRREIDLIYFWKLDRMMRNERHFYKNEEELENYGIGLRFATQDLEDPFTRSINVSMAAEERRRIIERTQRGRRAAAKSGKWIWGPPPYGYRLNKDTKKLVINKKEAGWIREFFKWIVDEKLSLSSVHKRANELKVPCYALKKRKNPELEGYWHKSVIARILNNPIYTGTDHFYRYKRGKKRLSILIDEGQQHDKKKWISFTTDNIITPEQFALAQKQLLKNREMASRNLKNVYLFNKLLYCGKCGLKLFAGNKPPKSESQNIFRFYHGGREPKWKKEMTLKNKRCDNCGDVGESRLESIWDTIKELLEKPEYMIDKLRDYNIEIPIENVSSQLEEASKLLKNTIRKKKRIDQVYESSDTMEYSSYQKKIDQCKRDEEKLKNEIALLNQKLLRKDEIRDSAEHFRKLHDELRNQMKNATYEERSEIIHLLVDKITLYKDEEMVEVKMEIPIVSPLTTQDVLNSEEETSVLRPQRLYRSTKWKSNVN